MTALETLKRHWPEYVMEAAGLAVLMVALSVYATVLFHPDSLIYYILPHPLLRRIMLAVLVGLTYAALIYSPWGQQSGAHLNPAITLTFFRLGKVSAADTFGYIGAQFLGAIGGLWLAAQVLEGFLRHPLIFYAATFPGFGGSWAAFAGELWISFLLMFLVLAFTNDRSLAKYTGLLVGALITAYIIVEAPFSGMSMNPARTFASALFSNIWQSIWVYFSAPPIGMLLAAEFHLRIRGDRSVICAKLFHDNSKRCIFHQCGYRGFVEDTNGSCSN